MPYASGMARAALATVIKLLLSLLLAIVLAGLWSFTDETSFAEAFLDQGTRLIVVFVWPGLIVWAALSILGMLRRRGLGWGIGWSILAALIAAGVNLVVFTIIGFALGGWDAFIIVFAFLGGLCFFVAAVIASVFTHLVFRDRAPAVVVAPAPPAPEA